MTDVDIPLRLLAVEDDPTDRSWLELMLKDATLCPYAVQMAVSMSDAEVALGTSDVDCVLLDLSLPDCDGVESVRRIHAVDPDLPIVVFTGHKDQAMGLASIEAGAQDYLVKGQASGNTILQSARWARARQSARSAERAQAGSGAAASLVQRLGEAWVTLDATLRLTRVGPPLLRLLDRHETEVLGGPLAGLLPPAAAEQVTDALHRLLREPNPSSVVLAVPLVHRQGLGVPRVLVAQRLEGEPSELFVVFATPPPRRPPVPPGARGAAAAPRRAPSGPPLPSRPAPARRRQLLASGVADPAPADPASGDPVAGDLAGAPGAPAEGPQTAEAPETAEGAEGSAPVALTAAADEATEAADGTPASDGTEGDAPAAD